MPHAHALMCVAGSLSQSASQPVNPFHEKMASYLSQGYAVIYVVESNVTQIVQNLPKIGMPVEDYVESGTLKIIDADSFYSLSKLDYNILLLQWHKVLSSISKKSFKGVMVMGMPHEAFFDNKENQQKLIEYEEQVAKNYDNSFQVFCCYKKESLDKLPLGYLVRLLAAHQDVATSQNDNGLAANLKNSNSSTDYLHVSRLVNLVEEGLATALGKETSALVIKTLKLVYKINKDDIVANSELFEEKIKRMFGDSGEPILKIIAERLKTEMMYGS